MTQPTEISHEARECAASLKGIWIANAATKERVAIAVQQAIDKAKAPLANKLEELRNANTDLWAKFLNEEQQRKYKEEENTRLKEQIESIKETSDATNQSLYEKLTTAEFNLSKAKESIRVKDVALKELSKDSTITAKTNSFTFAFYGPEVQKIAQKALSHNTGRKENESQSIENI